MAEEDIDVSETAQAVGKLAVHFRLNEAVLAFPSEFIGLRIIDDDALDSAIDQTHDVLRGGVRADLIHQADALDGAQGLVI